MFGARRLRKRSTAVSAPRAEARTRASVESAFARAVALRACAHAELSISLNSVVSRAEISDPSLFAYGWSCYRHRSHHC